MLLTDLHEAKIGSTQVGAAMSKIISYLERALGGKLRKLGREHFHNSNSNGWGDRYVLDGTVECIRFNWAGGKSSEIESVDVWTGSSHDPNFNVKFKGISLVKSLPDLARILKAPKIGSHKVTGEAVAEAQQKFTDYAEWKKVAKAKGYTFTPATDNKWTALAMDGEKVVGKFKNAVDDKYTQGFLTEAKKGEYDEKTSIEDMIKKMEDGRSFNRSAFVDLYHPLNAHAWDDFIKKNADKLVKTGARYSLPDGVKFADAGGAKAPKAGGSIEGGAGGSLEVSRGGRGEEYEVDVPETDHISFVDSLEHLEGLTQGLIRGSFNALFVAGKGGTGKTQTVEDVLEKEGLRDGSGYFKNTGSASAIGVYTLLYKYRDSIILFDDSDGALGDQDARNLIKAATDTKKVRKMVWNKKSAGMYDPDAEGEDSEGEEGEDPDRVPKYFNFTGRIIFISNLPLNKLDPDGALRTRAFVISINPTPDEIFERMDQIVNDIKLEDGLTLTSKERQEVLSTVKTSRRKNEASLRTLVRALNLAASGAPNWKKLVELYA